MKHIMIDLETLGRSQEAAFVTIGAVYFDPETGEIGDTFYKRVDLSTSIRAGRKLDGDTIVWWFQQEEAARKELFGPDALPYDEALDALETFVVRGAMVWSNGATFDIAILENAYQQAHRRTPWKFRNVWDVRTIGRICKGHVPKPAFEQGTKHNALDDAIFQAHWVSKQWQYLKEKLGPPSLLDVISKQETPK